MSWKVMAARTFRGDDRLTYAEQKAGYLQILQAHGG
jgi:hypothetical protein